MNDLSQEVVLALNYVRNTVFLLVPFILMTLYKDQVSAFLLRWKINRSRHKSIVDDTPIYREGHWWILKSIDEEIKNFVILERRSTLKEIGITHAKFVYNKISIKDFWWKEVTYAGKINGEKI